MLGSDKGDVSVAGKLAKETGCDVWFSYYQLCTDHCITESYDIAFECYRQMIGLYGVRNVSACGFSSGGTLAIGIAYNNAIRGELPQPRHIVAVSPGIAVYETLKTVMTPEEAFRTVHGYVEAYALSARKMLAGLLRLPGLYRLIPGISARMVHKIFGEAAGFAANEYRTAGGVMRIDMVKCPYHETCVWYGCPELCACFCDSDDIAYDNMHPKLIWHRTKTLGRGGDCCDFGLRVKGK